MKSTSLPESSGILRTGSTSIPSLSKVKMALQFANQKQEVYETSRLQSGYNSAAGAAAEKNPTEANLSAVQSQFSNVWRLLGGHLGEVEPVPDMEACTRSADEHEETLGFIEDTNDEYATTVYLADERISAYQQSLDNVRAARTTLATLRQQIRENPESAEDTLAISKGQLGCWRP